MADANWSKYTALFRLRGGDGATSFPDVKQTVALDTVSGVSITTSQNSPFGQNVGVMLKNSGSGQLKNSTANSAIKVGTGDFSFGGWVKVNNLTLGGRSVFALGTHSTSSGFQVLSNISSSTSPYPCTANIYYNGSNVCSITPSTTVYNNWTHFNVSRQSGLIKLHVGGVGSATYSANTAMDEGFISIGNTVANATTGVGALFSEFYFCNGQCLYWDDFTPPTAPTIAPTLSGTVQNANNAPVARTVRAYLRATGVLKGEIVSSGTSGAFSMEVPDMAAHTIIALDDGTPDENAQIFDNVTPI